MNVNCVNAIYKYLDNNLVSKYLEIIKSKQGFRVFNNELSQSQKIIDMCPQDNFINLEATVFNSFQYHSSLIYIIKPCSIRYWICIKYNFMSCVNIHISDYRYSNCCAFSLCQIDYNLNSILSFLLRKS